jgi:membrane fusion protein (multidrug efflux system)
MKKNTKRILYSLLVLIVLAGLAAPKMKFLTEGGDVVSGPQASQRSSIPVEAFVVTSETVRHNIFATGTVVANEEVALRSEASGMITAIYFEEGSRVQKDELLLKINDADLQAQLLKQQYQLELTTDRENRQRRLLDQNLISRENYDLALNALNTVKSEIAFLEAQIHKTEIQAPFDGIIGLKYISQGSYISPATRIANLINFNPVKIDFSVAEKYANFVHKGDSFTYKIVGTDKDHRGKVLAVEPRIDPSTRTLQVRGISPNETGQILPGAFAEVELVIQNLDNAIMVPTVALIPELQGQKVFLVEKRRATPRRVTTGIRTEAKVQILDGLAVGDTLITSGILQIRPGSEVNITEIIDTTP